MADKDAKPEITSIETIRTVKIDEYTSTLIHYDVDSPKFGRITIQTWADGIEVWIGGECRYRSWSIVGKLSNAN
jgi:hypothetical protein